MSISKGGQSLKPYVGGKEVSEAYVGSQLVYKSGPNPVTVFNGSVSTSISPEVIWMGTPGLVEGNIPNAKLIVRPGINNGFWCKGKFETLHLRYAFNIGAYITLHFYKDNVDMGTTTIDVRNVSQYTADIKALANEAGIDYDGVGVSGRQSTGFSVNFAMLY